jgi:hypothetical protein
MNPQLISWLLILYGNALPSKGVWFTTGNLRWAMFSLAEEVAGICPLVRAKCVTNNY